MRKRFALAALALLFAGSWTQAATYYVSNHGNDAAAGTSPQQAWRTIARVNRAKLQPGDNVLFQRGGLWREQLQPPAGGTKGKPITFAPYGQGPRPVILGSVDKTGPANWAAAGKDLWYCSNVQWQLNYFKLRQGMIFHDGLGGQQMPDKAKLAKPWQWWIDPANKRAYVYLDHNPGLQHIEVEQRNGVGFCGYSYITIRGLEIAYAEIGVGIWQADGWVIDDCDIHDVVVDGVHINGTKADPPDDNTVRNCHFRDWNWKGYDLTQHNWKDWGKSAPFMGYGVHVFRGQRMRVIGNTFRFVHMYSGMDCSPIAFDDGSHASLIADNYVDGGHRMFGPTTGLMLWATQGDSPVVIRDNVIKDVGGLGIIVQEFKRYHFTQPVTVEDNLIENVCWGDSLDQEALRVWTGNNAPVTVRNNVVYQVAKGKNMHPGIRVRQSTATLENNTVIGADRGVSIENHSTVTATGNISTDNRQSACTVEGASKLTESGNCWNGKTVGFEPDTSDCRADPKLADPAKGDFAPAANSPCATMGARLKDLPTGGNR